VLSLDRDGGELRLDGGQLPRKGGSPLGRLLGLRARHLVHLSRALQRGPRLLVGALQGIERLIGRNAACLGRRRLTPQAGALLGSVLLEPGQLGFELGDPRRGGRLVGLVVEGVQPQLPLPERAAQVPVRELQGLGPRPYALGRGPRLGEKLSVAAAALLPGGDPLLDRGTPGAHLLEALLNRVTLGTDLGESALRGRQLLLLRTEIVSHDPRAQLVRLAKELRSPLSRLGLALQRPQP
jgi:hypothetical protein